MNERNKTIVCCAFGGAMLAFTWATAPRVRVPPLFADRGDLLFPAFTDPNTASSLEVVQFDPQQGTPRPFKVVNRGGRWLIPSHHDYPADAADRLAQTAAVVVELRKEDFVSDNPADHARCGVLDPLDVTLPAVEGRGTRLTIGGAGDTVLADLIIGHPLPSDAGLRYVRAPQNKRVYISRVGDFRVSTAFSEWIDRDLLQADRQEIDRIIIRNYSVNESTRTVDAREALEIVRRGDEWRIAGLNARERVDASAVDRLISSLDGLTIVDVLPKPEGITGSLSRTGPTAGISGAEREDLARKGFYLFPDGRLLSNEGDVIVRTRSGIFYTLRFGEVAPSTAPESAGSTAAADPVGKAPGQDLASGENRYLFVMVAHDPGAGGPTGAVADRLSSLRVRFAPWYFVIGAESFANIRLARKDLIAPAG